MSETTTAAAIAAETETKYQLRDLEARDVFAMSKIINGIGIAEFKTVFNRDKIAGIVGGSENKGDELLQEVGIDVFLDIAGIIMKNISKCDKDLYKFIASLADIQPQQVEHMPMNDFFEVIIEIVQKREFADFMQVVSKLFK